MRQLLEFLKLPTRSLSAEDSSDGEQRQHILKRLPVKRVLRFGLRILLILAVLGVLDVARFLIWPDVGALKKQNPQTTAFMEYRKEQWAEQGRKKTLKHQWVKLRDISPNLVKAVTIAEDDRFWMHEGFDFEGIEEALLRNLEEGRFAAGGSTISQQLAKNLYFTPTKSLVRKLREAVVTWRVENELSKSRILELYLNCIEWGDGVFGVGAASRHYFGKSPSALTPNEAAALAAILPNPLKWSPTSQSRVVKLRKRIILRRLERRLQQDAPVTQ
ncbi:monofunctional biosynthetic peptidoglycan transglycosylase [Desulfovibrio mangrovi]|uniref:monofunctional biosynthetic peptidoglycan transglycosylase n=1 Tax=Desulfovibrio mangrovi TaxID=2976983 RepID=UPI002247508E|nr:monofunctional biosynthetic peptidoglycan transglycosylase [Desulfovibrio mangrovi]UZP68243.1 monofunctional biosynthetic peptidoglycan transglycosylase [Desulfovibrio mangrovi]